MQDERGMTFDQWFAAEGFSDEFRLMFAKVWNGALDNAKLELDDEWHWLLNNLMA